MGEEVNKIVGVQ